MKINKRIVETEVNSGFEYKVVNSEIVLISHHTVQEILKIPETMVGYPVTHVESLVLDEFDRGGTPLVGLHISKSVRVIETDGLSFCEKLTWIDVDPKNQFYSSDDNGVLYNKDKTKIIRYPAGKVSERFEIPTSVVEIEAKAFYGCDSLLEVVMPQTVRKIGCLSFGYCEKLEKINVPKGVKEIEFGAFYGCASLKKINIQSDIKQIGEFVFSDCISLENIAIPECVKSIGDDAFFNCHELKTVVISNELDYIGERAFYGCKSLVNFYISNGVKEIGVDAFLKSAVSPSKLES